MHSPVVISTFFLVVTSFVGLLPRNAVAGLTTNLDSLLGIHPLAFFKNSVRREPTQEEKETVVKMGVGGCTAFFVKNSKKRTLLITARHCVSMSITNWCNAKGTFTDTAGIKGTCSGIVAADVNHDIAMFEGTLSYTPTDDQGLALAGYVPELKTPLQMIGYPADKYRNRKLTTTENCWITQEDVASPHGANMADKSSRHNCTTYGGNSGGPMIAEGTRTALGLPFTYYPNNYVEYAQDRAADHATMARMEDFASVHRKALVDAGVEILSAPPKP